MPEVAVRESFLEQVVRETPNGERLKRCIQCGSCGGSCPSGAEMELTPRALFALIRAGDKERVLRANTMWKCVSCYFCTVRCPQEIPITHVMYALKRIAIREGLAVESDAPALAHTFSRYVDRYGRSFELGIASRYLLVHKPGTALRMGPTGLSMLRRGRLSLAPKRIRDLEGFQAIVARARELEREESA